LYIRVGKRLPVTATEVMVELKQPPGVVFNEPPPPHGNYLRFRLSPDVVIAIGARAKHPGEFMQGDHLELSVVEVPEQGKSGRMEEYERLLGDAMDGDPTLFAGQDEVDASWAIVEPVLLPMPSAERVTLFASDCSAGNRMTVNSFCGPDALWMVPLSCAGRADRVID